MNITQPYTFDFPTVGIVESHLNVQLSPIASNWAGQQSLSYCCLGNPQAYGTIDKSKPDNLITGIDIPVLIKNTTQASKGVVLILAQDPLRKPSDYPRFSNWKKQIVVSLPFGVHVDKVVRVINETCEYILSCGYDVYITDCTKIYRDGQGRKTDVPLLIDEINELNIQGHTIAYYVAFGNRAQSVVKRLHASNVINNVINIVHPSGSANAMWKKTYSPGCTDDDKIEKIREILCSNGIK